MSAYLVRVQNTHELVGIFWANNLVDLGWTIDEALDPSECEYKKLKFGGIYWGSSVDVTLPLKLSDDDESDPVTEVIKVAGAPNISEYLLMDLLSEKGWKNFDASLAKVA